MCISSPYFALLMSAFVLLISAPKAMADPEFPTLVVGVDMSSSAPLLDPAFAQRSGQYVAERISAMPLGSTIQLKSLGEYAASGGDRISDSWRLTRSLKPQDVALGVGNWVYDAPQKIGNGELRAHEQTAIIGFLINIAQQHRCSDNNVEVILISDGMEYSSLGNFYDLLANGSSSITKLSKDLFTGCSLTILGLGRDANGISARQVEMLRKVWINISKDAGFVTTKLLNDW